MPRAWSAEVYASDYKRPSSVTTPSPANSTLDDPFFTDNATADALRNNLQAERQEFQKNLYTKWLNSKLYLAPGHPQIDNLFEDLRNGRNLLLLMQVLTGKTLKPVKGNLRLHHLNNLTIALDALKDYKVKLIGINNDSITDGEVTTTLGLCWSIMYHFQVIEAVNLTGEGAKSVEEFLLKWCCGIVENYSHAGVSSFQPKKWHKGYTLNALIHAFKPELFRYSDLSKMTSSNRLNHAFQHAEHSFGVSPLFTVEEFNSGTVDSKAVVLYISTLYERMRNMERPGFQEEKEDESPVLYEQLRGLERQLIALDQTVVSAPPSYPTQKQVEEMESTYIDIQKALNEINDNLNTIANDINSSTTLKVDDKNELQQKNTKLLVIAGKVYSKWEAHSKSVKENFEGQATRDNLLLSRWMEKSQKINNWLDFFEQKLPELTLNTPSEIEIFEMELNKLTSKFGVEESDIQAEIEFGNALLGSQTIANKQSQEILRKNIDDYAHRKVQISSLLMEGKTKLLAVQDEQRHAESEALDEWLKKAEQVKISLRAYELASQEKHGNSIDEIRKTIDDQEQLLKDLDGFQPNLDSLFVEGDVLSKDWTSEEKIERMRQKYDSVKQFSKNVKRNIIDNLERLKHKLDENNAKEKLLMSKWNDKSQNIYSWLEGIEEKIDHLTKAHVDEPVAVANYTRDLESLSATFDNEECTIQEEIDYGNTLLCNGEITDQQNQNKLFKELANYSQRKCNIGNNIKDSKARLKTLETERDASESMELNTWMERASGARKMVRSYGVVGGNDPRSMQEINDAIVDLQRILQNLNRFQPNLDELYADGEEKSQHWSNEKRIEEMRKVCDALNTLSKDVKESLQENIERLKKRIEEQNTREGLLLSKWQDKSERIDAWLRNVEEKLTQLKFSPGETIIGAHSQRLEALSAKYNAEEGNIQEDIDFGLSIENSNQILNKENKEKLHKDVVNYNGRKSKLATYLLEEKVKVVSVAEHQRANESKELNKWLEEAAAAKKALREYEVAGEGKNMHGIEETKKAINELESLLQEIRSFHPSLDVIYADGDKLSKHLLSEQKKEEIKQECQSLDRLSKNVTSVIHDTLERSKQKLDKQNATEELMLLKWEEKSQHISDWLDYIEEKCSQLDDTPNEASSVDLYAYDFEVLKTKFNSEEGNIRKDIDFGSSLLHNDAVQSESRKQQIHSEIEGHTRRKCKLDDHLQQCKLKLDAAQESLMNKQAEDFGGWLKKIKKLKISINGLQKAGQEKNVTTQEDIQNAMREQEKLFEQVDEFQASMQSLISEGEELSVTYPSKSNELQQESKALDLLAKRVKEDTDAVYERYKKKLEQMEKEKDEQADNILMRLKLFHDWIQFAEQQLEFVKIPSEKSVNFNDLIQKEQGLNKLSADMDGRLDEFDEFKELMEKLSNGEKEITKKDEEVLQKIRALENEWDYVIETTDQEFKSLYDRINSMVDKKRGEIEKTLGLVEKQLKQVGKYEEKNKDKMNEASHVYMEICSELSKIKPPIANLCQHTNALNDVSIFVDDEKEVMRQTSESLQMQYVQCRDGAEEIKKRLHSDIIGYLQDCCQESYNQVEQLQESSVPLDSIDQNNLASMKNFLKEEQKNVEKIKAEHFKIDDLEQFAESISKYGIVSAKDQVSVADDINKTLKHIEDTKKEKKSKINRIYAIAYHTLNQDLRHLINRLHKAGEQINDIKKADIIDYEQAAELVLVVKNNEDELRSLEREKEALLGDLKEVESILELSDVDQLHVLEQSFDKDSAVAMECLLEEKNKLGTEVNALTARKLNGFMGWFPVMKKRSEETSEIGPDQVAIEKQLQEVKIIEQQANHHSFVPLFEESGNMLFDLIDEDKLEDIKAAHEDWTAIKYWLNKRKQELDKAHQIWDEFDNSCIDLSDYLRQTHKDINTWNNLDLNDDESVHNQKELLEGSLVAMETRKPHAMKLNDVTGLLLDFIGDDSQTANKVRSQVADVFDVWNNLCKKNIENTTKLKKSHKQFKELVNKVRDIRKWITGTVVVLEELSSDEKDIEESIKKFQFKRTEHLQYEKKMDEVVQLNEHLTSDGDTVGHFTMDEDVELLQKDFVGVTNELERLQKFLSKVKLFLRRARQSFKNKLSFDDGHVTEHPADGQMDDVSSQVSDNSSGQIAELEKPHRQQQSVPQPIAVS